MGSGPDRGRSPVEWGDFPFVRSSVRPSVPPSRAQEPARQALDPARQASEPARQASEPARQASEPASQPGLEGSEACLAGSEAWLDGSKACLAGSWALEGGNGWTNGRMDGRKISPFYRTSSPIGATAPLQPNFNPKTIKRGKGTTDDAVYTALFLDKYIRKQVRKLVKLKLLLGSKSGSDALRQKLPYAFASCQPSHLAGQFTDLAFLFSALEPASMASKPS